MSETRGRRSEGGKGGSRSKRGTGSRTKGGKGGSRRQGGGGAHGVEELVKQFYSFSYLS